MMYRTLKRKYLLTLNHVSILNLTFPLVYFKFEDCVIQNYEVVLVLQCINIMYKHQLN